MMNVYPRITDLPASYIIFNEDGVVYARNGKTNQIDFSGTDASTVIQSAINSLTNGGKIFIKRGTYMMTYKTVHDSERVCISLAGKNNIEIVGEGTGTVLKLSDNQNATIISLYNGACFNKIRNIKFDGNKMNNQEIGSGMLYPNGVNIRLYSNNNIVQECMFVNIKAHPILIITTSHRNLIVKNYFENNDWYDIATSGGSLGNIISENVVSNSIGLESYLNSNTIFTENSLYNSPRPDANTSAVGSIISDGVDIIADNFIIDSQRCAIRTSMDSKANIIVGNNIINPCKANLDGDAGILVYGSNKLVSNNIVSGSLQRGIYVRGNDNIIHGNFVTNSSRQNILVYNVKGNKVLSNIVSNGSKDIELSGTDVGENVVAYNMISGSTASPIMLIGGYRNIVSRNTIRNVNSVAILLDTGTNFVEGNTLLNVNAGSIPNGAIVVNIGSNNTVVKNNVLIGSGVAGIVLRGDDCIVEGNFITGFTYYGILDYSRSRNLIRGNRVFNNTSYDIRLLSTVDAICIDNDVRGSSSSNRISDEGTNTIIKRNLGYVTENIGIATFSGDGSQTVFTIAHGLAGTPKSWRVEAGSSDAKGDKYVTADATNLTVTFATAPPAGTNNVVLVWSAEM